MNEIMFGMSNINYTNRAFCMKNIKRIYNDERYQVSHSTKEIPTIESELIVDNDAIPFAPCHTFLCK